MPERLLHSVVIFAKKQGTTRSGLLNQAVTEYMASYQGSKKAPGLAESC
jgi:hypothetical protein